MTMKQDYTKLAEVKDQLAAKYENLAKCIKSKPRKATYLRQAEKHKRQSADLKRKAV
jgi:hypothetical protein